MQTHATKNFDLKVIDDAYPSSIVIEKNDHWKFHTSVAQYIEDFGIGEGSNEIPEEILSEMKRTDSIVRVEIEPKSLGIIVEVFHYDRDKALELANQKLLDKLQEAWK